MTTNTSRVGDLIQPSHGHYKESFYPCFTGEDTEQGSGPRTQVHQGLGTELSAMLPDDYFLFSNFLYFPSSLQ